MIHYLAIVQDSGRDEAVGLWFPDLPGCFSAGDTVEGGHAEGARGDRILS